MVGQADASRSRKSTAALARTIRVLGVVPLAVEFDVGAPLVVSVLVAVWGPSFPPPLLGATQGLATRTPWRKNGCVRPTKAPTSRSRNKPSNKAHNDA